ncbi:uncharacterized protein LOC144020695 [Festucalex cinctus]
MSLKNRKFSLDSSVSQDPTGLISCRRASIHKLKKYKTNLEDSELDIQEINPNSNGTAAAREKTPTEESIDRPDGLISKNSFHKHNKNFHKLFQEITEGENLTHTFTCALQKEVIYHGRLYISENHACFFSSVLLKETKVAIHKSNIQEVKKQNLSMLSIQTTDNEKYLFMYLRNRELCFNQLQNVCLHTQGDSAKSSPYGSSAENEADSNMVSSHSSNDDSVDHGRSASYLDEDIPQLDSQGPPQSIFTTEEADGGVLSSQLWKISEDVTSYFFLRQRGNFSTVFYIYLLLLVLLLLASGYIGLRMIALERQLNILSELSSHHGNHQET